MSSVRSTTPLIVTQKPSRASREPPSQLERAVLSLSLSLSVTHQDPIESSDQEELEGAESPRPLTPTDPSSLPLDPPTQQKKTKKEKKEKKKKIGSFLFRRRKKKGSHESVNAVGVASSEECLTEFANVLVDPSVVRTGSVSSVDHAGPSSGRLLSLPSPSLPRSLSDSQVCRVCDVCVVCVSWSQRCVYKHSISCSLPHTHTPSLSLSASRYTGQGWSQRRERVRAILFRLLWSQVTDWQSETEQVHCTYLSSNTLAYSVCV